MDPKVQLRARQRALVRRAGSPHRGAGARAGVVGGQRSHPKLLIESLMQAGGSGLVSLP